MLRAGGYAADDDHDDDDGGDSRGRGSDQRGASVGAGLMSEDQRAGLKKVCCVLCAFQ